MACRAADFDDTIKNYGMKVVLNKNVVFLTKGVTLWNDFGNNSKPFKIQTLKEGQAF